MSKYRQTESSMQEIPFRNILFDDFIEMPSKSHNFIEDIRTDINPCSIEPGYEPFAGILWGGIMEGWDWTNGRGAHKKDLLRRACSQIEIENGWESVEPIDEKYLNVYRGRVICMKRSRLNFHNSVRPDINGNCPDTLYKWGKDASPPSKIIWVQNATEWPINSVKILKSSSSKLDSDYKTHPLEEGWIIATSRNEADQLPIVRSILTEGSPCINPYEIDITNGRYIYPLARIINNSTYKYHGCLDSINGEFYKDPRFIKLDQIDEEKLFKDNNIYLELKSLPMNQMEYTSASFMYGLFVRPVMELDLSCEYSHLGLSRNDMVKHEKKFDHIEQWHSFLNKACLFYISAVLILMIPFLFMILVSFISTNQTLLSLIKPWSVFANGIIMWITIFIIFVTFIWMYKNWSMSEFISLLVKNECSSKTVTHIWVHLYEILLYSNQLKFFMIGACTASFIAQIVFLRVFWNIDKNAKEDEEENNRLSHLQLNEEIS